jgi:hypothetical protein
MSKYLDFKTAQVWTEIASELKFEGIRPVSADLECIEIAEKSIEQKGIQVQKHQKSIIRRFEEVTLRVTPERKRRRTTVL